VKEQVNALASHRHPNKVFATVEDYISQYTDVFTGEGKLEGLLHLEIDKNVQPVQLPTQSPHCPQRASKT